MEPEDEEELGPKPGSDEDPMEFIRSIHRSTISVAAKRQAIRATIVAQGGKVGDRKDVASFSFADTKYFVVAVAVIAVLNMLVVGAEVDHGCVQGWLHCNFDERGIWYAVELIFTFLFFAEMAIRIAVKGPTEYFRGDPLKNPMGFSFTNCVDFLVVFLRVIDSCILAPMNAHTVIKIISCGRVLHITELVRRAHTMPAFRELWMILHGMMHAGRVVFWTSVLLFLIMYITAIVMTNAIIKDGSPDSYDYSSSAWSLKPWTVYDYWGTVPKSLMSLFQVLTLDHWCSTLARPLVEVNPSFVLIFVPFLAITVLSLLNVIVATIVESTLGSASVNDEKVAREELKLQRRIMASLKDLFEDADTDGSGELDRQELEAAYSHHHVRNRLKVLQLNEGDLMQLFDLLDEAGTGSISTDAFFRGCTRLRGSALSRDLHHMAIDFGRNVNHAVGLANDHHEINNRLANLLANVEGLDREVVAGRHDKEDPVLMNRRERYRRVGDPMLESRLGPQFEKEAGSRSHSKTTLHKSESRDTDLRERHGAGFN